MTPEPRPIGPLIDAHAAKRPERVTLKGRWITLTPLDPSAHAQALYEGSNGDAQREAVWDYLFDGPYASFDEFRANLEAKARSADPMFFTIIDNATGRAVGYQTFLRIEPAHRVIEVGNIMYTPAMQRTAGATEAQYLFAAYVFDTLGYRRFEWKCHNLNEPSKRAAERFGFTFEGIFRQHMVAKGRNRDTAWFAIIDADWPRLKAGYERWLSPENFDESGQQKSKLTFE